MSIIQTSRRCDVANNFAFRKSESTHFRECAPGMRHHRVSYIDESIGIFTMKVDSGLQYGDYERGNDDIP